MASSGNHMQMASPEPVAMEVEEGIDHFARIPEDLVASILCRLANLKHIFQCSLVSKRFASSVTQVKSVYVTLPSTETPPPAFVEKVNELFPQLATLTSEEIIRFIQSSSLKELKFIPFVQTLSRLKSIALQFVCRRAICTSSIFYIRVHFSSERAIIQKFVSFVPDSVYRGTGAGYEEEPSEGGKQSIADTFLPYGCCGNWLLVLCLLAKCHPSLENIRITNRRQRGNLVLQGPALTAWRNSFVPGGFFSDFTPYARTTGLISEMHLPATKFVMNGVSYVIARFLNMKDSDDYDALAWEYMGDDNHFEEVLCEFLRRHADHFIMSEISA